MIKNRLLTALILIFLIIMISADISKRTDKIIDQHQLVNFQSEQAKSLFQVRENYEKLEKPILNKERLSNFVFDLKSLAKKYNVALSIDNADDIFENLTINVSAGYYNLTRFFYAINKSFYPVQLTTFDIKRNNKNFVATVNGKVFSK